MTSCQESENFPPPLGILPQPPGNCFLESNKKNLRPIKSLQSFFLSFASTHQIISYGKEINIFCSTTSMPLASTKWACSTIKLHKQRAVDKLDKISVCRELNPGPLDEKQEFDQLCYFLHTHTHPAPETSFCAI